MQEAVCITYVGCGGQKVDGLHANSETASYCVSALIAAASGCAYGAAKASTGYTLST